MKSYFLCYFHSLNWQLLLTVVKAFGEGKRTKGGGKGLGGGAG